MRAMSASSGTEEFDFVLEGEELQAAGPCVEEGVGRVLVPTRGRLFDSDGRVTVAVIRPCMSRGKRLRGYPPIYEAAMLGRNANVFTDWHMWMGHMSQPLKEAIEEIEERLQESVTTRRLFSELGGRVVETWFDPSFTAPYDDEFGYRPGATMGKVIPYPAARQILEADPDGLHVSIAAWPTSARVAAPSWDPSTRGMAVEGFRRSPRGSVDWVLRGGAGGRPVAEGLTEAEVAAVSALEALYDHVDPTGTSMRTLREMTLAELRESLTRENPELARELGLEEAETSTRASSTAAPATTQVTVPVGYVSEAVLDQKLEEQRRHFEAQLAERDTQVERELELRLAEAREYEALARTAQSLIKGAGLPRTWTADLMRRYAIMPSGPAAGLLVEETDEKSAEDVLKEAVEADIQHARDLIQESGGTPMVRGLGGGVRSNAAGGGKPARPANTVFRDFLVESGDDLGDRPEDKIKAMVQEGIE